MGLRDLVPCSLVREAHIGVDHQEGGTGSTGISSVGGRGGHHPYDLGFKIIVASLALVVTKYITLSMLPNKLSLTIRSSRAIKKLNEKRIVCETIWHLR